MGWDWQGTAFDWMPEDNYSGDWGNYVEQPASQEGYTFEFDDSWEPDFDYEFSSPTGEYGPDAVSQYEASTPLPSYLMASNQEPLAQPYTAPEESKNSWFSGLWEGTKDFAGTDLGKKIIAGSVTGLGSLIVNKMDENAKDRRAREARDFTSRENAIQREHQLALQSMKGGSGGGSGPATTKATTSSLDQNIIRAR